MSNKKVLLVAYSTDEVAALAKLRPNTIRSNLCRHGHWLGIRPVKLANRRLLWDADEVGRVLRGERLDNSNLLCTEEQIGGFENE